MFKDHFSKQSPNYARFRPSYPEELFDYLAQIAPARELAWDCATGTGQAARGLYLHFQQVFASDASTAQIESAGCTPGIEFRCANVEHSGLPESCVDLVSVAQALHWFDLPAFYAEVRRVLKPGGVLAVWCYHLLSTDPLIDSLLDHYYTHTVGSYWPPERRWIESGYSDLPFPFAELQTPHFTMQADWTLEQLYGYLRTWSSGERYHADRGYDPLDILHPHLSRAWGDTDQTHRMHWPLALRVGRYLP